MVKGKKDKQRAEGSLVQRCINPKLTESEGAYGADL